MVSPASTLNSSAPTLAPDGVRAPRQRLQSLLPRIASWLDRFIPPSVAEESEESLFRARVAVGTACIASGVFLCFAAIRAENGVWALVRVNVAQSLAMLLLPLLLRRTGRLRLLIRTEIALAFASFVLISVRSTGSGFTLPAMGLVILPLLATLLCGTRSGAYWTALATAANIGLAVAANAGLVPRHGGRESVVGEHGALEVLTLLLFTVAALYEYRKAQSLAHIEALERARHGAERNRIAAEAKAQMAETERLAALGQIAAMAAHEINNPLSYVTNNLEHIAHWLNQAKRSGDLEEAARDALDGVSRIRRIVDDLRTYAHPSNEGNAVADVPTAVAVALKTAEGHTRPRAKVTTCLDAVPKVAVSHHRLVQVILNFVVNAAQAIPEGHADENEITVLAHALRDGRVSIEVRDTGPGIPREILGRVTEPFFTTKGRGEGSGLGLALSDQILKRYGGKLEIENAHVGVVARAILPAARESRVPTPPPSSISRPAPADAALSVLVVDDEALVSRAVARALPEHAITTAASGKEALSLLDDGRKFDAILCDVMMPELSGMDVYELVRQRHPDQARRIVFMTGGTFTDRAAQFRNEVDNTFVDKPLQIRLVRKALRAASKLRSSRPTAAARAGHAI